MRILILGGDGMLGHRLLRRLGASHEARVTLRRDLAAYEELELFDEGNAYAGVDIRFEAPLLEVLGDFRPHAIVNAVGIVKQRPSATDPVASLRINALLPHRLRLMCQAIGARLVHFSTDCVFSGDKGMYTEDDPSDAGDLYGRSKHLGEVDAPSCLTLRTSIIGPELNRRQGLLEWLLAETGQVRGFTRAIFSGVTTLELSGVVERLLVEFPEATGVYHVSSEPISKYDLLMLLKEAFGLAIEIVPDDSVVCDRSLDSSRFREEFQYTPPSWTDMVSKLAEEIREAR